MNTSTTPTYAPIDLSNLNLLLEVVQAPSDGYRRAW